MQNNPLKKKKKVSLSNIDSQNHKHKLRFERGHEPKNKKIKKTQFFFLENSVHQGSISNLRLLLDLSLSQTTKISMIEGGFVGVVEIFLVRVEIGVELELRLKMIVDDRLS